MLRGVPRADGDVPKVQRRSWAFFGRSRPSPGPRLETESGQYIEAPAIPKSGRSLRARGRGSTPEPLTRRSGCVSVIVCLGDGYVTYELDPIENAVRCVLGAVRAGRAARVVFRTRSFRWLRSRLGSTGTRYRRGWGGAEPIRSDQQIGRINRRLLPTLCIDPVGRHGVPVSGTRSAIAHSFWSDRACCSGPDRVSGLATCAVSGPRSTCPPAALDSHRRSAYRLLRFPG